MTVELADHEMVTVRKEVFQKLNRLVRNLLLLEFEIESGAAPYSPIELGSYIELCGTANGTDLCYIENRLEELREELASPRMSGDELKKLVDKTITAIMNPIK